jgi:hypothetical protein
MRQSKMYEVRFSVTLCLTATRSPANCDFYTLRHAIYFSFPSIYHLGASELPIAGLQRLLLVRRLLLYNLLVAGPVHSLQALCQDGVRMVEAGVEPVGIHARQVLDLELDQRSTELARIAKLDGESICIMLASLEWDCLECIYQLRTPCGASRCSGGV